VEFRVLGPLEARADGRLLDLGGLRQRRVLACLLLRPNQVVDVSVLADVAWDGTPPPKANRQVRNRIAALRAVLTREGAFIDTEDAGYRLRVGPGELDATVFDELVERGREAGDATLLRQALALWRGPALADLDSVVLAPDAAALEEKRLGAVEECVDLELAAGRHAELLDELHGLVSAHPLRERLVGHLVLALYRCGRPAEALTEYRTLATRLADELGIDPGADLRRLSDAVQHGDPALRWSGARVPERDPSTVAVPQQLPADVAGFTGRLAEVERLGGVLSDGQAQKAVIISAIAGTAGVGKTALAVHWAHRVRDKFPDGQLFVNLRGYSRRPALRPIDALAGFLRALGVAPDRVPADLDQACALYRAIVADRRILVLLDNAAGAEHVRPLLPGGSGSLALITSRETLADLAGDGARRFTLGVLAPDDAQALLARILGAERVAAEPAATAELARLCAYLPLALRIAAANLAESETIAGYCARLAEGNRLGALQVDGDETAAVRAAFDLSYVALPLPAQRLFRLLGLVPGPDLTLEAAAALADIGTDDADPLLDRLATAHLIDRSAPGRYAFHDLLRLYAAEHAHATPEPDAEGRLYDFYVRAARVAGDTLNPSALRLPLDERVGGGWAVPAFAGHNEGLAWLDSERANLVAAAVSAAEHGPASATWLLADALNGYLYRRAHIVDLIAIGEAALATARAAGELRPQAIAHMGIAHAAQHGSRYADAIEHLTLVIDLARRTDWPQAQIAALQNLGLVEVLIGRAREAAGHATEALALSRQLDWTAAQARNVAMLGVARHDLGELAGAADCYAEALALYRGVGSRVGEAGSLDNLGEIYYELGQLDRAREHLTASLVLMREAGVREGETDVLRFLASVERAAGRPDEAFRHAETALALARESGLHRYEAHALNVLGELHDDGGRHLLAAECLREARLHARTSDDRYPELVASTALATVYGHLGRHEEALALAGEALAAAAECGYRLLEGRARIAIAEIYQAMGQAARAVDEAERALAVHRSTGHRLGELRALDVLAEIRRG
jgi:DNA-binding SARP family transcriptional activator